MTVFLENAKTLKELNFQGLIVLYRIECGFLAGCPEIGQPALILSNHQGLLMV
jgi:hypothetical protein